MNAYRQHELKTNQLLSIENSLKVFQLFFARNPTYTKFFFIQFQGKGIMKTYWLTCRDAPILNFKDNIAWYADMQPVFLNKI